MQMLHHYTLKGAQATIHAASLRLQFKNSPSRTNNFPSPYLQNSTPPVSNINPKLRTKLHLTPIHSNFTLGSFTTTFHFLHSHSNPDHLRTTDQVASILSAPQKTSFLLSVTFYLFQLHHPVTKFSYPSVQPSL